MVAQEGDHIGAHGDVHQDFQPVRAPVNHVAQDVQRIGVFEAEAVQELDILVIAAVDVGDSVLHMGCTSILSGLCLMSLYALYRL